LNFPGEKSFLTKKRAAGLLVLFVLAGSVLRFHELGKNGFWTDELLHVIGAKSMLETGSPIVPGKGEYTRAYPITVITALSIKHLGESELTARIPFVLFNLFFVVVGYLFVRRLFNENIALIFSFVMAFSPFEIVMSRECRMYSLFQLLYVSGSMLFFMGMEPDVVDLKKLRPHLFEKFERSMGINLTYLGMAAIVFLASKKLHDLTLNFGLAATTYFVVMMVYGIFHHGIKKSLTSKYSVFLAIVCAGFLAMMVFSPGFFTESIKFSKEIPVWVDSGAFEHDFYQTYLVRHYPVFTYFYPLSILIMIIKYREKGVFVFSAFFPLILAHSFVYTGKNLERYIFYIFPFLVLGASCMIEICIAGSLKLLKEYRDIRPKFVYVALIVSMLPAIYIFGKPWLGELRSVENPYYGMEWKSVSPELRAIPENSLIISTRIKPILYYAGRMPDYNVRKSMFEVQEKDVKIGNRTLSINIIGDSSDLGKAIEARDNVYFLAEKWSWNLPVFLDEEMRSVIKRNFIAVEHNGNKDIMIWKKIN
jgi:4-amino-4-deoxy-L-arabinose transferase-like glycosyltransferase